MKYSEYLSYTEDIEKAMESVNLNRNRDGGFVQKDEIHNLIYDNALPEDFPLDDFMKAQRNVDNVTYFAKSCEKEYGIPEGTAINYLKATEEIPDFFQYQDEYGISTYQEILADMASIANVDISVDEQFKVANLCPKRPDRFSGLKPAYQVVLDDLPFPEGINPDDYKYAKVEFVKGFYSPNVTFYPENKHLTSENHLEPAHMLTLIPKDKNLAPVNFYYQYNDSHPWRGNRYISLRIANEETYNQIKNKEYDKLADKNKELAQCYKDKEAEEIVRRKKIEQEKQREIERLKNKDRFFTEIPKNWIEKLYEDEKTLIDNAKATSGYSVYPYEEGDQEEVQRMDDIYATLVNNADKLQHDDGISWDISEFVENYVALKEFGPRYSCEAMQERIDLFPLEDCSQSIDTIKYSLDEYFKGRGIIPEDIDIDDRMLPLLIENGQDLVDEYMANDSKTANQLFESRCYVAIEAQRYNFPPSVSLQETTELLKFADEHSGRGLIVDVSDIAGKGSFIGIANKDPEENKKQIIELVIKNNLWSNSIGEYNHKIANQLRDNCAHFVSQTPDVHKDGLPEKTFFKKPKSIDDIINKAKAKASTQEKSGGEGPGSEDPRSGR